MNSFPNNTPVNQRHNQSHARWNKFDKTAINYSLKWAT